MVFGLAPALHISNTNFAGVLEDGSLGAAGPLRSRRWTAALSVAELALALILLAGTGLLVRSFINLYSTIARVESRDVVTARVALPLHKYSAPPAQLAFFERLTERMTANPAVGAIAVASELPFMPVAGAPRDLTLEGGVPVPGETQPSVPCVFVTRTYFDLVGLPLIRGRATDTDWIAGQQNAIVNQRFASMYFPDGDPIGRRLRIAAPATDRDAPWLTIVGVVASAAPLRADKEPEPMV